MIKGAAVILKGTHRHQTLLISRAGDALHQEVPQLRQRRQLAATLGVEHRRDSDGIIALTGLDHCAHCGLRTVRGGGGQPVYEALQLQRMPTRYSCDCCDARSGGASVPCADVFGLQGRPAG